MYGFSFDEVCDDDWDVGCEMLISIGIVNKSNIIIKFHTLKVLHGFFITFFLIYTIYFFFKLMQLGE
jgi:hypothetical protein